MKKQVQFFSFCLAVLFSILFFQITTGCGKQNFFQGKPSAFLLGREAYYSGDYTTALNHFNQVTGDATATADEKKYARFFSASLRLARTGNDLVSLIGKAAGKISFSSSSSQEIGSLAQSFIPTTEAAKTDVKAAADTLNSLIRDNSIGTRDAAAPQVALVSAQAAVVSLTDTFDGAKGGAKDGKLDDADVRGLETSEVASIYSSNPGSFAQYLDNAVTFGGGSTGQQLGISNTALATTDATANDIDKALREGKISGDQLADLLGKAK